MKIGIITPWFNRGLAHVSRQVVDIAAEMGHEIHILATNRLVNYTIPKDWQEHNITIDAGINENTRWLNKLKPNILICPEIIQPETLARCRKYKITTIWIPMSEWIQPAAPYNLYDIAVCPTQLSYKIVKEKKQRPIIVTYCRWVADIKRLGKPTTRSYAQNGGITFFCNIGWGGMHNRQDIPSLYKGAFYIINKEPSTRFIIKMQRELPVYDNLDYRIKTIVNNVPYEEIINYYNNADFIVSVARFEGIGLPTLEALAMNRGIICGNYNPLNEFVRDNIDGYLYKCSPHGLINNITVMQMDANDLMLKLQQACLEKLQTNSRERELKHLKRFKKFWKGLFNGIETKHIIPTTQNGCVS